jgi:hypothetical protein
VKFDDLAVKAKNEKWEFSKVSGIKANRIAELKKIVSGFGAISQWQEAWEHGYAFATFVLLLNSSFVSLFRVSHLKF